MANSRLPNRLGLALCFYFLEYASRSAPAVMIEHLAAAFGTTAIGVSAILGTYYYTYSITSLIAGAALDRVGAKKAVPVGISFWLLAACCLPFRPRERATPEGSFRARVQLFAFTGAVYLASHGFSARWLATAIGVTQCLGMLGGSAGQFVVGPWLEHGVGWQSIWHWLGIASLVVGVLLFVITPSETRPQTAHSGWASVFASLLDRISQPAIVSVRRCGRTSFCGHHHWRHDLGRGFLSTRSMFSYHDAVVTSSLVPLGWVVGCPLVGWLADFVGRRKPVLIGGAVAMLLSAAGITFSTGHEATAIGCFIFGIASGAAMIPYTIVKEVNPDEVKGSATGGINFLTFGVTALIGPIFADLLGKGFATTQNHVAHFRASGIFWMTGIAFASCSVCFLRETGHARNSAEAV